MTLKKSGDVLWKRLDIVDLNVEITARLERGERFVGLLAEFESGDNLLHALFAHESITHGNNDAYSVLSCVLPGTPPNYPTLATATPAASIFEREIRQRFGFIADGHETPPLLFPESIPEASQSAVANGARISSGPPESIVPQLDAPGAFQFSVGPVRSGITESQQFVFETVGEEMLHLTVQLYYKYRGIEQACEGRTPESALPLIERISGRSSFAHSLAFCQAIERIIQIQVPQRALYLRTLFAELERLYSHFHDLSELCESTSIQVLNAQWSWLKEQTLRLNTEIGAARYLRNINTVGGVRLNMTPESCRHMRDALAKLAIQCEDCAKLSNQTYSHIQRLEATGTLSDQAARDYACVGPIARACALERDTRRSHPYAAYGMLDWHVAGYTGGDALARMQVRLQEIEQSFHLLDHCLAYLEKDSGEPIMENAVIPSQGGVALGWAETPRGETVHFVRLDDNGRISRVKFRTPSLINWQPFSLTIAGIMMPDFAVNKASWNLSIAGNDL